jgi:hypothetical protein
MLGLSGADDEPARARFIDVPGLGQRNLMRSPVNRMITS